MLFLNLKRFITKQCNIFKNWNIFTSHKSDIFKHICIGVKYFGIYCVLKHAYIGHLSKKGNSSSMSLRLQKIQLRSFLGIILCLPTAIINLLDDNRNLAKVFLYFVFL